MIHLRSRERIYTIPAYFMLKVSRVVVTSPGTWSVECKMMMTMVWTLLLVQFATGHYFTLREGLLHAGRACSDPNVRHIYTGDQCSCEAVCAPYGICCQDSEYFVPEQQRSGASLASCVEVGNPHFYMMTSCPSHWEDQDTRTRCRHPDITYPDPLVDVPVTSRRTNITYYNGHCAICHGDFDPGVDVIWPVKFFCGDWRYMFPDIQVFKVNGTIHRSDTKSDVHFSYSDNFTIVSVNSNSTITGYLYNMLTNKSEYSTATANESFNLTTSGSLLPRLRYDVNSSSWFLNLTGISFQESHINKDFPDKEVKPNVCKKRGCPRHHYNESVWKCQAEFRIPQLGTDILKECRPDVIDKCHEMWMDDEARILCESYTQFWYHNNFIYRNPFCAYCNYVDVATGSSKWGYHAAIYVGTDSSEIPKRSFFENELHLDLDWSDVKNNCPSTEVHDPLMGLCRNVNKEFETSREKLSAVFWTALPIRSHGSVYLAYVSLTGLSVSVITLVLHPVASVLTSRLKNLQAMNLTSLSVSLLFLYCTLIAGSFLEPPCMALAVITHYSLLVTFFWMLTISCDIWMSIKGAINKLPMQSGRQWKRFSVNSACCWIVPVTILTPALIVQFYFPDSNFSPGYGVTNCWFQNREALLVFVVAPLYVVMTANVVFCWSAYLMYTAHHGLVEAFQDKQYFLLELVMVVTWTVHIIATGTDLEAAWFVFVILNTLQCIFIFINFTFKGNKVLKKSSTGGTSTPKTDAPNVDNSRF